MDTTFLNPPPKDTTTSKKIDVSGWRPVETTANKGIGNSEGSPVGNTAKEGLGVSTNQTVKWTQQITWTIIFLKNGKHLKHSTWHLLEPKNWHNKEILAIGLFAGSVREFCWYWLSIAYMHFIQCHLPDFVLGNLKHSCVCSELTKLAFLGVNALLACLKLS